MNAMRAPELDSPTVTYEEYLRWPETTVPCEFVDGRPVVSPSPALRHQVAITELVRRLGSRVPPQLMVVVSPVDWVIQRDPLLVRQPDLVVIDADYPHPRLLTPPYLAVEVVSPTSRERDLVTKRAQYAAAGLDWYWLVDIDLPQILVLRRDVTAYATHASTTGDDVLTVDEPFPVRLRPSDLA